MQSNREMLEASLESFRRVANHERRQFLASFIIAATGSGISGAGIERIASGHVAEGIIMLVGGGGVAGAFGKRGLVEVERYTVNEAAAVIKQSQLEELDAKAAKEQP